VGDKILSPFPNLFWENFLLHPHSHGEKFSIFGSLNGAIPARSPFTDEIDFLYRIN
jgi:hypothetical protein